MVLASGKRAPCGPVAAVETKNIRGVNTTCSMTYRLQRKHAGYLLAVVVVVVGETR